MRPSSHSVTREAVTSAAIKSGDVGALARALTLLARGDPEAERLLVDLDPQSTSRPVGFVGPPGVGKSSLLRELTRELRQSGERVGILALDPVSELTGGAFLGDRIRFAEMAQDRGIFFRSWGHRAAPGETPANLMQAAGLVAASGYDWTLLESAGIGQTEVNVFSQADTRVLVLAPSVGDGYQMLKAGYMEAADIYVVHQSDRPDAHPWAEELRRAVWREGGDAPIVIETSAVTRAGISELISALRHRRRAA